MSIRNTIRAALVRPLVALLRLLAPPGQAIKVVRVRDRRGRQTIKVSSEG